MATDLPAAPEVDLEAYLNRIGHAVDRSARPVPTRKVLDQIHFEHVCAVPFENLDIHLGRTIRVDLPSVEAKLVTARRGGYCFEHNTLFAAVLDQLGFKQVVRLAARVRMNTHRVLPRTHMLLTVECEGVTCMADVGFGGMGLLKPIPLVSGLTFEQYGQAFRLKREGAAWVLESVLNGAWTDLYVFTLEPQHAIDYEMANHYTSTFPASRFVHTLTVQSRHPELRQTLHNHDLEVVRDGQATRRTVQSDEELLVVLAENFGLHFPPGTQFRSPLETRVDPTKFV